MVPIVTNPFSVERGDYLKAMWARRFLRRVALFGGMVVVVTIWVFARTGSTYAAEIAGGGYFALYSVVILLRYLFARYRVYNRKYEKRYSERTLTLTGLRMEIRPASGIESAIPWEHVQSIEQKNNLILIFFTPVQHAVVDRRAFKSKEDLARFETFLASRFNVKKIPLF
jgi:hypothetical protein